jgi:hypothetical protein
MLRDLRVDLNAFAQLTTAARDEHAAEILSFEEDIGPALAGFVRRLDVTIEIIARRDAGRHARRRARKP